MQSVQGVLDRQCTEGLVPGVVAVASSPGVVEFASSGVRMLGGSAMARDTIFRIASLTKPIVAAATMALIDRGHLSLEDPVDRWLPELSAPLVLGPPGSMRATAPAKRAITVRDLLTFQHGLGFPAEGHEEYVQQLVDELHQGPPHTEGWPTPQDWMRRVAAMPLLHQPGEGWTYQTGSDLLGVLLSRCREASLQDVLTETILGPLQMLDTGFHVPEADLDRVAALYRRDPDGGFVEVDPPAGQWSREPVFASGAGGLVSTVGDWHTFAKMLLGRGTYQGRAVLSQKSVALMTSPQASAEPDNMFLQGQAWGFGGAVDVAETEPWNRLGRYGWIGGTGTAGYIYPARGAARIWLSQVMLESPQNFDGLAGFLSADFG